MKMPSRQQMDRAESTDYIICIIFNIFFSFKTKIEDGGFLFFCFSLIVAKYYVKKKQELLLRSCRIRVSPYEYGNRCHNLDNSSLPLLKRVKRPFR